MVASIWAASTPAEVTAAAREAIQILGPGGELILGPGCALGADTPADHIHALVEAAWKYGVYNPDGSLRTDEVGDWRDVLHELPRRIHEWMPRLASEGVVGADAIFACLGPALEIFSRYSRVEKSSGEAVTLKEYLERVWAAVSKEALNMIFSGADATGVIAARARFADSARQRPIRRWSGA